MPFDSRPTSTPAATAWPIGLPPLSADEIEAFGRELDALRAEVLASRGERDAAYIRGLIRFQRRLEVGSRAVIYAGIVFPPALLLGATGLGVAKILENMEIGHNVMHGQWDWMRDDQVRSVDWEWDNACPSRQWLHTHNHVHHQWTNVAGMDRDIGYGILRVDDSQRWRPHHLGQPLYFVLLALLFEYGVSLHDLESDVVSDEPNDWEEMRSKLAETAAKIRSQVLKDYVAFPLLSAPFGPLGVLAAASGAAVANVVRNVWSFSVIFCGHFPDGVEVFPAESAEAESRGGWYRRQILGSANFVGGPLMHLLSGNLDHQIEHHLFPDLPSNRYAEVAPQVQEVCERHGLTYNTGSMVEQFGTVVRKVLRLSLPFG